MITTPRPWIAGLAAATLALAASAATEPKADQKMADKADKSSMSQKSDKSSAPATPPAIVGSVLVLLPVALADDRTLGNGCWVRFYDGQNYRGSSLTLVGPVDMPKMTVPGAVWRDWDSAVVGPKATVTTFDDENFRERTAKLSPGAVIPDLRDKKLGWFDEIHSARLSCSS